MAVNCFDVDAILGQIAEKMSISEDEVNEIKDRLLALSAKSYPPVWGYAGMLLNAVNRGAISLPYEVQTTIDEFEASPRIAKMAFDSWNAARLAKS